MYRARDELVRMVLAAMLLHTEAGAEDDGQRSQRSHPPRAESRCRARGGQTPSPGQGSWRAPLHDSRRRSRPSRLGRARRGGPPHSREARQPRKIPRRCLEALPQRIRPSSCVLGCHYERRALADTVDVSLVRELYTADHEGRWRRLLERAIAAFGEAARASELSQEAI